MKKIALIIILFLAIYGCKTDDEYTETITIHPENIQDEEGVDIDLHQNGLSICNYSDFDGQPLPNTITIYSTMPEIVDLSPLMPPVKSQGNQGSCVSFATTYYLKSYQEKKQYNYDYLSDNELMSPAFVYNQTKASDTNCSSGSCFHTAFNILKNQGANTLADFPYQESACNIYPTDSQLETAITNKIASYHKITDNSLNTDNLNLLKTLLIDGYPITFGINVDVEFSSAAKNNEGVFIYNTNNPDPNNWKGHALLIVGYNDNLNAFKFINSWGTNWGNDGYGFISYNFFKDSQNANFETGVLNNSLFIAIDQ